MSKKPISITLNDVPVPEEISIFCKIHNFDVSDLISALIYPGIQTHILCNYRSLQQLVQHKTILSDLIFNSLSKE